MSSRYRAVSVPPNPESKPNVELPVFQQHKECTLCPLHQSAKSCGIPTRKLTTSRTGSGTALLVIGEKPGYQEDLAGKHFVGDTGDILNNKLLKGTGIRDMVDVYLSNAVRCKPPAKATVTQSQFKACKPYLLEDIQQLTSRYERVILLGAGAGAARTLRNSSLDDAFLHQGEHTLAGLPTFYTFNPFLLSPDRDPSKLDAVIDHLLLLKDFIATGKLQHELQMPEIEIAVADPGQPIGLLSLDIETYGAVQGLPRQTVFQPQRSIATDGVRPEDLVQTVALAWETPDGQLRTSIYDVTNPEHKEAFENFIDEITLMHPEKGSILGMNLPFDVMYLRAWNPWLATTLIRENVTLRDLGVINYLHSEVRPERSLKSITPLLQITNYDEELSLKKGDRYDGPTDERLWYYNCKDAVATLSAYRLLEQHIRRDYDGSGKLSPYCLDWYDHLLWFAIESSESGVAIDKKRVTSLDARLTQQSNRIRAHISDWWGASVSGTGSKRYVDDLVHRAAVRGDLLDDKRLVRTEKKDSVSSKAENLNLFEGTLPRKTREWMEVHALQLFRRKQKLQTSFTGPLLNGRKKGKRFDRSGVILDSGLVHPTWYVVPSQFEDASGGGTIQGRITCKNPAIMTFPEIVKECLTVRFAPGILLGDDLSQIELRTGALLSGDSRMISEYKQGIDRHLETAVMILRAVAKHNKDPFAIDAVNRYDDKVLTKDHPGIHKWRQLGKTLNFLMLFKGGAAKAQETAARDVGLLLPLEVWQQAIASYQARYPEFIAWQYSLLDEAKRKKYLEVPFTGQTRMFLGGSRGVGAAINEIVNMPIQTVAANTMISAHRKATELFREHNLEAISSLIIYDAMYVELPAHEEPVVRAILDEAMTEPPYWMDIQQLFNREVPLQHEVAVLCEKPEEPRDGETQPDGRASRDRSKLEQVSVEMAK